MTRALLMLLLVSACASGGPQLRDSPQYRACKKVCADEGAPGAAVVEDDDSFTCLCKRPPETA